MQNGEELFLLKVERIINQWKTQEKESIQAIDDIYDAYSDYSEWDEMQQRKRLKEEWDKNAQTIKMNITYGGPLPFKERD